MGLSQKTIYGPALLSNADALLYTVPAGAKDVVRWIHVSNNDASNAHTLFLSKGADAAGTRLYDAYSIAAGEVDDFYPIWPLEAAETIRGHSGTTNVLNITIEADEYTL